MPTSAPEPLLKVSGLEAGYGNIGVLHGLTFGIGAVEIVGLLVPNGAGKTTLLRTLSGLLPPKAGSVRFAGADMRGAGPRASARAGAPTPRASADRARRPFPDAVLCMPIRR